MILHTTIRADNRIIAIIMIMGLFGKSISAEMDIGSWGLVGVSPRGMKVRILLSRIAVKGITTFSR